MPKILIVDDSRYQRSLIESHLSAHGECVQAENGSNGVEAFRQALEAGVPFDLVVMDILMPIMDGHEALAKIVALQDEHGINPDQRAKSIMLSSMTDSKNMLKAQFESGADIYITKPFEGPTIVEALRTLGLSEQLSDEDEEF